MPFADEGMIGAWKHVRRDVGTVRRDSIREAFGPGERNGGVLVSLDQQPGRPRGLVEVLVWVQKLPQRWVLL